MQVVKWLEPIKKRCCMLFSLVRKVIANGSDLKRLLADHFHFMVYIYRQESSAHQLDAQRKHAARFVYRPLISVIIPIYRVPKTVLQALLSSLERQTYPNWQACIVWADSDNLEGWRWLQNKTQADHRFKCQWLTENGGISHNSNAALELVTGDYVALLDHDDTLTPWAFFAIVEMLQNAPETDFIYSDKDLITAQGHCRLQPFFRPGWSPEMLNSANYLTHLNVIRTTLLREIGGWRSETDGAQDWDLFLRLSEHTQAITRIPSILYHWRMLSTSTALDGAVKPYVPLAQLKTLQTAFLRRGLTTSITPEAGRFHIHWPIQPASTDVVLFQSGTLAQLITLIEQMYDQKNPLINRLIVVHNTPVDSSLNSFKAVWGDRLLLIPDQQVTWCTALLAVPLPERAPITLLIDGRANSLSPQLLPELASWVIHHPDIAWSSAVVLNQSGIIYEAGRVSNMDGQSAPLFHGTTLFPEMYSYLGSPSWYRNASACSPYAVALCTRTIPTACAAITAEDKRTAFTQFCLALTAQGGRGVINPFAKIYFDQPPEDHWPNEGALYQDDPYFHPAFKQVSPFKLK